MVYKMFFFLKKYCRDYECFKLNTKKRILIYALFKTESIRVDLRGIQYKGNHTMNGTLIKCIEVRVTCTIHVIHTV